MTQETWNAVDTYIADLLVQPDAALEAALADSVAAGLPAINVTPNQGKFLNLLARIQRARLILEIGTLGGYSTIWLARALPADGRLITLEAEPEHARVARANIARAGLGGIVDVRLGLALDTLPQLAAEGCGPFDLIFIDADKPSNPDYFAWALRLSRPGSVIIIDNVVRGGAVVDAASRDASVQGVRRLNEMLAAEPRVSVTALQTVGSKGYDGFALALVTTEGYRMTALSRNPQDRRLARWWWRYWNSIAICGLAIATFISGFIGFSSEYLHASAAERGPRYDLTLPLFKTFQLFLLGSGADDTSNISLSLARVFAMGLFLMISWAVISRIAQEISLFPKRYFRRGHVVICGLGEIGLQLLDDLSAARISNQVVVIEPDEDNPWLNHATSLGADVIQGDATRRSVLHEARVESAERVFAVTGDDGGNLEIAAEIAAIATENVRPSWFAAPHVRPQVYTHILDTNLATAFQPHARMLHDSTRAEIKVFNVMRNSVTQLITRHLWLAVPTKPAEVSHFFIIGFEAMGQTLAVQLAQLAHFPNRKRSRFTIADRNISSISRKFLARFNRFTAWNEQAIGVAEFTAERDLWTGMQEKLPAPLASDDPIAIDYVANARFEELPDDAGDERFAYRLAQQIQLPGVKPVVFVCGQQDRDNFEAAIRLRDRLYCLGCTDVPFFVWLPHQPALAQALTSDNQVFAFGSCRTAAGLNEIEDSQRDYFARQFQRCYEENEVRRGRKPQAESWNDLTELFRESNRQQADHMTIKLAELGYSVRLRAAGETSNGRELPPIAAQTATVLSEMEHNRWVAERLLSGWRYAAKTDRPRKLHRLLVASEHLQPEDLAIDLNLIHAVLREGQRGAYLVEPLPGRPSGSV